jgi:hypothetical protein
MFRTREFISGRRLYIQAWLDLITCWNYNKRHFIPVTSYLSVQLRITLCMWHGPIMCIMTNIYTCSILHWVFLRFIGSIITTFPCYFHTCVRQPCVYFKEVKVWIVHKSKNNSFLIKIQENIEIIRIIKYKNKTLTDCL